MARHNGKHAAVEEAEGSARGLEVAPPAEKTFIKSTGVAITSSSAEIVDGGVGILLAGGAVTVADGGVGVVVTEGDVQITDGGAGLVLADGDVSLRNGGAAALCAGRDLNVTNGGAGLLLAGNNAVLQRVPGSGSQVTALVAAQSAHVDSNVVCLVLAGHATVYNARPLISISVGSLLDHLVDLTLSLADGALALLEPRGQA